MKIYFALIITTLGILITSSASAQTPFPQYWDPTASATATAGGTGNWDPTDLFWYDGTSDVAWTNGNDAYFEGTAGTVTLTTPISVGDIYFTNVMGSYTITNATGVEILSVAHTIDTGGGDHTISALIANSTTLNKNGNGRLYLPIDNTANWTGNLNINQGEVSIETNFAAGNGTSINVANGAALELNGFYTNLYNDVNGMTITGTGITNSGALRNVSGYSILDGNLTFAGNSTIEVDSDSITYDGNQGSPINTSGAGNYNVVVQGNGQFQNGSQGFNIGTGTITVLGHMLFVQYVTTTYANNMVFSGIYVGTNSTYQVEDDGDFGPYPAGEVTTNVILDGGTLANFGSYFLGANRGITITGNGGSISNASGTFDTSSIFSQNSDVTFDCVGGIHTGNSTTNVVNLGTGRLIKNGSGDLNTASPALFVFSNVVLNAGSLSEAYDMGLGAVPTNYCSSNIWLNGGSIHVNHSTTLNANRGIYITPTAGSSIEETTGNGGLTVASVFNGPGSLTIANGATGSKLQFTGNNTYAGTTTINSGVYLIVGANGTSGTLGAGNTAATGNLFFDRAGSYTYGANISGTGIITNEGSGTVTFAGTNTYTGATVCTAGTLLINGTNATSPITVNSGATLGGTGKIAGTVTILSGGKLALGLGTLSISNNVTISGNVTVSVNPSASPSSGMANVSGTLTGGSGTVTVTDVGSALAVGETFQLFNEPVSGGSSMTITGGGTGVTWNNSLAGNGTISVATVPAPSKPVINKVQLSGGNFIFSGTNGVAGTNFIISTSTNLLLPTSLWTPISTNPFLGNGGFSFTNAVTPGTPNLFYLLQIQ